MYAYCWGMVCSIALFAQVAVEVRRVQWTEFLANLIAFYTAQPMHPYQVYPGVGANCGI